MTKIMGLGQPGEYNKYKIYYFVLIIVLFAFIAFSWIGQVSIEKKMMVSFYAWLGLLSIAFILFDNLTTKKFDFIDTVLIEKTPVSPKIIAMIAIAMSIVLGTRIFTQHKAFVPYPTFQFFDHSVPNAILSGVAGIMENMFFFSFLFPTIYILLSKYLFKEKYMSAIISILLSSFIFMMYHIFVYAVNEVALVSCFLFALLNTSLIYIFRTTMIADALHFTNNVIASLVMAGVSFILW